MNIRALFSSGSHPMSGTIMIEIDSGSPRTRISKESIDESDLLKHLNDPFKPLISASIDDTPVDRNGLKRALESLCT